MTGGNSLTSDVDLDIAGLLAEVWRKKWIVAIMTVLVGGLLFAGLSLTSPRYKASARVLIEKGESVFTRQSEVDPNLASSQFDEQAVGSQVQVLTSDDIALRVIGKLGLTQSSEFSEKAAPGMLESVFGMFSTGRQAASGTAGERMLKAFHARLVVYAAEKSRVVVVEFWAHDAKLAQDITNALVDEYLAITKQAKLEAESKATGWLGPEIEDLRAKVKAAEGRAAEFRASSDILIGNNNALLATQQLSEVSSELSRLRAQKSEAEARVSSIRSALASGVSLDTVSEVISSPLIQRLRERQVSLRGEISQLETTLLPNHPRLKALKSQIGDFDRQIQSAANNILKSFENNVALARKQETALLAEVERLKAEAARVGEAEVELRALEREANAQRELLESYLGRFREAASRQQGEYQPVDARIISRAILPTEPYFPKVVPFTLAGATVAMILAIVGILSWALLTGKALLPVAPAMREPSFAAFGSEATAAVPELERELAEVEAPALQFELPAEPLMEVDDPAQAALQFEKFQPGDAVTAIRSFGKAIIAVISPEGSSGFTQRIARELSDVGKQVAVIDLSADGEVARAFLGEGERPGLFDLAAGKCGLPQALFPDLQSTVQVMPAGNPAATDDIAEVRKIVDAMAESFDYLVLDCGDAAGESLTALLPADAVILVDSDTLAAAEAAARVSEFEDRGFRETIAVAA